MTTVLLDARNLTATPSGVGRYAESLIPRMIAARPDWDWTVLRHASYPVQMFDAREVFVHNDNDGIGHVLRGHETYREAMNGGLPDLLHSLFHIVPHKFYTGVALRLVVTVHDFIWIDHPGISQRTRTGALLTQQFARRAIPMSLRAADAVIAVSEATASRAREYIDECEVVPHGVEDHYFEPLPPRDAIVERLAPHRYVAAVGNDKQYKNLQVLLRAAERVDALRVVLVGSCEGLRSLVAELRMEERVIFAGSLADADLRRVVGRAAAFVFPSLVEGFGLPPLEAMALGVPTIVSNLEPMRSVVRDAALRFEPTDAVALAELLRLVTTDADLAAKLSERGRAHARTHTWAAAAAATLAVYERALGLL